MVKACAPFSRKNHLGDHHLGNFRARKLRQELPTLSRRPPERAPRRKASLNVYVSINRKERKKHFATREVARALKPIHHYNTRPQDKRTWFEAGPPATHATMSTLHRGLAARDGDE